ncbi:MAG: TatD family hydrolase [Kiritimatiellia bacterium]
MTDAHYHRNEFETYLCLRGREFRFAGVHPWQAADAGPRLSDVAAQLEGDPHVGVGEIGLDRLRTKVIPGEQRRLFGEQLALAAERGRPVVLHGAKCWGEVVGACRPHRGRIPAFLFHGFSRSAGLLPEIAALNGFVSVGPALLNDHAVNYREMAKGLPIDRVLVETDTDWSVATGGPSQEDLLASLVRALADLRGCSAEELGAAVESNAARFVEALA